MQTKMKGISDMLMTKEQAETLVTKQTASILKQQTGKKQWGQAEHAAMLRNVVVDVINTKDQIPEELKKNIGLVLAEGSCGNASAYRQSLKNADGSVMFPKGEKVLAGYE